MKTFRDFNLNKALWSALDDLEIDVPTAIQSKTFSPLMSGKDIVGIAQTGTGKTYAYLLPTLRNWKFTKSPHPSILVIVPTRELVAQVVEETQKLAAYMSFNVVGVYGGTNMKTHIAAVGEGCNMLVGTPGRLLDLMLHGVLKTKHLKHLIIDEVDEMFNLGFRTQLKRIVGFLPERRQNLMFSATLPEEVLAIVKQFTDYYEKIEAAPSGAPLENIHQSFYSVPNFNSKANLLELLLNENEQMSKVLVFSDTKKYADALYERMYAVFEEKVGVIHSSKSQNNRFVTVSKFQNGTCRVLIATDIIARGLDVSGVTHVVNFALPDVPEKYIHRIGRTGRAESKGIAISFIAENQTEMQHDIESLMELGIEKKELPENLRLSDELISLEVPKEIIPFNNHKHKQYVPSGEAFHEKKEKNKKINKRMNREDKMKLKYKKPIKKSGSRGGKRKRR